MADHQEDLLFRSGAEVSLGFTRGLGALELVHEGEIQQEIGWRGIGGHP